MNTQMTHNMPSGNSAAVIDWKLVVRFSLVAVLIPLLLFVAAGRIDWWQGWVYTILTVVVALISRIIVFLKNPALIAERARFTESEGMKDWDKPLVLWIAIVGPIVFIVTAGLDKRFAWSADVGLPLQLGALLIFLTGFAFSTWALIVNNFFSSVVRIQSERGQTVVTSGPYHFVRHPGYAGGIVAWLVSPLLLGSLWSFIPAGLVVVLYIVRTIREDRMLQAELPGYQEYIQQTHFRLLPGVW